MYGPFQKARHVLRGGAALVLALLLCAAMPARAAGVTAGGADQDTSARMLVPVGHTVGIKLFARGVMVVKAPESGTPADDCGLQTGDIIVKCGGVSVTSSEQFQSLLQENGETATDLQVRREGGSVTLSVSPEQNEKGAYCIGAWIRDSMAGIGTMTYYDPESGAFGALGHGISDSDTGALVDIDGGELYETQILGIEKGQTGKPGVMSGVIYNGKGTKLGDVTENTTEGIYGTVNRHFLDSLQADAIPIGFRQDIQRGRAYIRSKVSGEVKDYEIEIQKVDYGSVQKNKGLVLKVVDEDLLNLTGGIVQGMSGSPIIQDGKLIGAVTHVFINDPTRGYGIFMENMLGH